jgi:integrase
MLCFPRQLKRARVALLSLPSSPVDAEPLRGHTVTIYRRKGTKHYLLDVTGSDGRRVRRSSGTDDLVEARHQEALLRIEVSSAPVFDIPKLSRSITLGDFVEQFLNHQAKLHPRSQRAYHGAQCKNFLGWAGKDRLLADLTPKDLQAYQAFRSTVNMRSSVNRSFQVLKTLFRTAVEWGFLTENPAAAIRKFREPGGRRVFLEAADQQRILAACQEPFRSLVLTALRTGLRRGELLGLRRRDVDFSRSHVTLIETKTDTPRHVPLLPEIRETLLALADGLPDDAKLFRSSGGLPYSAAGVETNWRRTRRRAGLNHVHFHDLRHSYASDCLAAGVPLSVIQRWLGHRSIKTTERYLHLADKQVQQAVGDLQSYLAAQRRHS